MRERGDLAAFAGAGEEGATATDSVAACICLELRRQYAIELLPSRAGSRDTAPGYYLVCCRAKQHPFGQRNARFRTSGRSLTPNRRPSDQIGDSLGGIRPGPCRPSGNHENVNKSKGPDNGPGLWQIGRVYRPGAVIWTLYSSSSGCSSGGARPSRPFRSSSSVMRSTATSVSSASTLVPADPIKGTVSGSGSSTSTNFCSE